MTDDLIEMFAIEPKLLPFLNMPIQSGSQNVLTRMNRPYSLELYTDIIRKLRIARPDIQISSDFIVGFPGETEDDFNETLDVVEKCKYSSAFTFIFSPREGTPAAKMKDDISLEVKNERFR